MFSLGGRVVRWLRSILRPAPLGRPLPIMPRAAFADDERITACIADAVAATRSIRFEGLLPAAPALPATPPEMASTHAAVDFKLPVRLAFAAQRSRRPTPTLRQASPSQKVRWRPIKTAVIAEPKKIACRHVWLEARSLSFTSKGAAAGPRRPIPAGPPVPLAA